MVHGRPHWGKAPEEGTGSSRRAEAAGRKEREWVLPLASGILLVAAYPPVDAGWLAWIALVPVSWAALRAGSGPGVGRGRRLLAASFAAGMLWGGGIFHPLLWIQEGTAAERVGGTAVIALLTGTILALYAAAVFSLGRRFHAPGRQWLIPPLAASAWVCVEYLVRAVAAGFSSYLGVTQWRSPGMLAAAAYGGVYGVSWLIAAVNAALAWAVLRRDATPVGSGGGGAPEGGQGETYRVARSRGFLAALGAAALAAVIAGGQVGPVHRLAGSGEPAAGLLAGEGAAGAGAPGARAAAPLRVVLLQPHILPEVYREAGTLDAQRALWRRAFDQALRAVEAARALGGAAGRRADEPRDGIDGSDAPAAVETLVVMPETVVHYGAWRDPRFREALDSFVRSAGVYWLGGLPRPFDPAEDGPARSGAADLRERNSAYLVDPGGSLVGVYDKIFVIPIAENQFAPGRAVRVFQVGGHGVGVGICSDVVAPDHALAAVRAGASSLHYLASLGHIGSIAWLERAFVVFRAAEHRVFVTQTATTGFTLVVDPRGRIVAHAGTDGPGALAVTVEPRRRAAPYTRLGDWVPLAAAVLLTAAGACGGRPARGALPKGISRI